MYLNRVAFWPFIPARVWEFTLGGYQVVKEWLTYRERAVLGRALTPEEAREVTAMARRIAALLQLAPDLDQNFHAVADNAHLWRAA